MGPAAPRSPGIDSCPRTRAPPSQAPIPPHCAGGETEDVSREGAFRAHSPGQWLPDPSPAWGSAGHPAPLHAPGIPSSAGRSSHPSAAAAAPPLGGGASAGAPIIGWEGWQSCPALFNPWCPGAAAPVPSQAPRGRTAPPRTAAPDSGPGLRRGCVGAPERLLAGVGGR